MSGTLIAILRGIEPGEAIEIGHVLADEGFDAIEVPLNSPGAFQSIRLLRDHLPAETVVGAGTVTDVESVRTAHRSGAQIIVAPNTDPAIIGTALELGLRPYPGVATVTEAFTAIHAGARSLKVFPADVLGIRTAKSWQAVLPPDVEIVPVGGIDEHNLAEWAGIGAAGAGIGSSLYRKGDDAGHVRSRARLIRSAWANARGA